MLTKTIMVLLLLCEIAGACIAITDKSYGWSVLLFLTAFWTIFAIAWIEVKVEEARTKAKEVELSIQNAMGAMEDK